MNIKMDKDANGVSLTRLDDGTSVNDDVGLAVLDTLSSINSAIMNNADKWMSVYPSRGGIAIRVDTAIQLENIGFKENPFVGYSPYYKEFTKLHMTENEYEAAHLISICDEILKGKLSKMLDDIDVCTHYKINTDGDNVSIVLFFSTVATFPLTNTLAYAHIINKMLADHYAVHAYLILDALLGSGKDAKFDIVRYQIPFTKNLYFNDIRHGSISSLSTCAKDIECADRLRRTYYPLATVNDFDKSNYDIHPDYPCSLYDDIVRMIYDTDFDGGGYQEIGENNDILFYDSFYMYAMGPCAACNKVDTTAMDVNKKCREIVNKILEDCGKMEEKMDDSAIMTKSELIHEFTNKLLSDTKKDEPVITAFKSSPTKMDKDKILAVINNAPMLELELHLLDERYQTSQGWLKRDRKSGRVICKKLEIGYVFDDFNTILENTISQYVDLIQSELNHMIDNVDDDMSSKDFMFDVTISVSMKDNRVIIASIAKIDAETEPIYQKDLNRYLRFFHVLLSAYLSEHILSVSEVE